MSGITAVIEGVAGPGVAITTGSTIRVTVSQSGGSGGTPAAHASSHADGGSDEVSLAASQITSGVFNVGRLGTGTPTSETVLCGDGTWNGNPNIHVTSADFLSDISTDTAVLGYDSGAGGWAGASNATALSDLRTAIGAAEHDGDESFNTVQITSAGAAQNGQILYFYDNAGNIGSNTFDALATRATASVAGVVVVGIGLGVSSGTISVTYGTTSGTACQGNDSRLSDSRSPTTHASTHQTGGADAVANVVVSPSQITSNQNDYSPGTGDIVRLSSDAARDITGITAGSAGQVRVLTNVGSFAITLKHQSASSTAANRFLVPWAGDCIISADSSVMIVYDSTTARWRVT